MTTTTRPAGAPVLPPDVIDAFRARLRGPLLLPDTPGYEDSRTVWNGMIDRRPALVARCLGVGDVVAGVNFARERGLVPTVKGGGHNVAGLAVADGALMLDLSLMRGVWVDPAARIARAQAGCLLGDVDRETQLHGLAAVLGFVSNTGIAGLTLGGGFGYLSRRWGWTSDNVIAMEVVTADGRIVTASETENADLFWGLRGGGGNFGVVTGFTYRLHPVGPEVVAGAIAWRGEESAAVFEQALAWAASAPPELALVPAIRKAPPAPWIAKEHHGKPIAALFVCHSGAVADGERLVAPIKGFGKPVGDVVMRRPYVTQQNLIDATQPKGRRYYWKSEYMPGLDPKMVATFIEHGLRMPSPHTAIALFPVGNATGRLPEDHSAVGNRDAEWVMNIPSGWDRPEDDAANIEWTRAAWKALKPFSTGGVYVNFQSEDEGSDRIAAAYRGNWERLVAIKSKWDPANLFRANKNIAPRA